MPEQLSRLYQTLKKTASEDLGSVSVTRLVSEMTLLARQMLTRADRLPLRSRVAGKQYFLFGGVGQSRPINEALYAGGDHDLAELLRSFQSGFKAASPETIVRSTYAIAYSVFAANDVYEVGRKASATFFEILIGHTVARAVGAAPRKKVRVPESGADLPTDYVFDPGPSHRKIHLPIKTSTRERAVQAWVHQLVLDRIFGAGVYRGLLVVAAETKLDRRTREVIEICVPRQLQMFQTRVTELSRVYYLDPPQTYLDLATSFPRVHVMSFGQVLADLEDLIRA